MQNHTGLKLLILSLSLTLRIAQADALSALNISLDSDNSPATAKIASKAKRLLGQGVKQRLLDRYIAHNNTESGFAACVSLNDTVSPKRTAALVKKLRQLTLNVDYTDNCSPSASTDVSNTSGPEIKYVTLYKKTSFDGYHQFLNSLVDKQADWEQLWHDANTDESLPTVDFNTQRVIGIFLGDRPDSCYSLDITSVQIVNQAKIRVSYQETHWIDGICLQALTQPSVIATIADTRLPVEFVALPVKNASIDETGRRDDGDGYALDFAALHYTENGACPNRAAKYDIAIVKDRQSWQQHWQDCSEPTWDSQTQSFIKSPPPLPQVNFDTDMVIGLISDGGGCDVASKIESIEYHPNGGLAVNYRPETTLPPPPHNTAYVCTADYYQINHWVSAPKSNLPVKLNKLLTKYVGRTQ
ncbi:hypothetical protein [Methylomonas sp. HYX-M1]|uniref:hypothetical protein n=1 Tax=Methylomonas sp. HYX-M1 TaxID=3139307 RepID=UPI00345B835E